MIRLAGHSMAKNKAFSSFDDRLYYLDCETAGIGQKTMRPVELSIIDDAGDPVWNSFINPGIRIPADTTKINGIKNSMIRSAPSLQDVMKWVVPLIKNKHVVTYNLDFDLSLLPEIEASASETSCCMRAYSQFEGKWRRKSNNYAWIKLHNKDLKAGAVKFGKDLRFRWDKMHPDFGREKAQYNPYVFDGSEHRALTDARMCRLVWKALDYIKTDGALEDARDSDYARYSEYGELSILDYQRYKYLDIGTKRFKLLESERIKNPGVNASLFSKH